MTHVVDKYGRTAGKIWKILEKYGPLNENELIKRLKINKYDFFVGIGWLARENKICKQGAKYQLGETNLTNFIGNYAGIVWNTLNTTQDIDISTIAEISQIRVEDAYSALGWLARENKIKTSKGKQTLYGLN